MLVPLRTGARDSEMSPRLYHSLADGRVITFCIPWHGVIFVCLGVPQIMDIQCSNLKPTVLAVSEVMCDLRLVVCGSHPYCYFTCCDHFLWF
jgi:hypothetical protein